ncbi:MAG: hypothetical protein MUF20_07020 [Methylotetracoccus sp.]|nr:hypothetical protein [Methylotetracoccus sp.]
MDNHLGRALALSILAGCPGCATTNSGADAPPPSRYKVTARVVDVAPGSPGGTGAGTGAVAAELAAPKIAAQPSQSLPTSGPGATKAPTHSGDERLSPKERAGTAEALEPRRDIEPPPNPEEQFLMRVASERPAVPLDGLVNGEAAVVNFVSGDQQCSTLAITYPARRVSEIWRVCADRQFVLTRRAEPTPVVPDDAGIEPARLMAVHSAYHEGRASVPYGPLTISAQSAGSPDERGCVMIRSALSWQGIPMAMTDETICLPQSQ